MWSRWRVSSIPASSAALRRPAALHARTGPSLHGSTRSTAVDAGQAAQVDDQTRARQSLVDLTRAVRNTRTPQQLTTLWATFSRHEPVVVASNGSILDVPEPLDENAAISTDTVALRMVGASEMLTLIEQGQRRTVVEETLQKPTSKNSEMVVSPDRVLLVSERVVAKKLIGQFFRLHCYRELTQFVHAFENAGIATVGTNHTKLDTAHVADLTALGDATNALYIAALVHVATPANALAQFEQRSACSGKSLVPFLFHRNAIRELLEACRQERNARLARRILDEALDTATLASLNRVPFTLGLQACLHVAASRESQERLHHALHIYDRTVHETGYSVRPVEWEMLVNACTRLGQHARTIELFRAYRTHGVAPFQYRFHNVLRLVCRLGQYDTAVEMARTIVADDQADDDDTAEFLNKILWKLLRGSPSASRHQVEQVLLLLQSRAFHATANVLRDTVTHFFQTATHVDGLPPESVVAQFFELWTRIPATVKHPAFMLRLVLDECDARDWREHAIEYAIEYARQIDVGLSGSIKT